MRRIYFDNAASTPLDPEVLAHMLPYFQDFQGNPSSTHAYGRTQRHAIEQARRQIAQHLHCQPYELYFTSGGTEADNTAILGAVAGLGVTHIITTRIEHHAVTHPVEHLEAQGRVSVTWLSVDRRGHIDLDELEAALQAHPKSLVCLMHGNNEIGTVYDLAAIGQRCQAHGAYFHSDTVQSMGNLPLNLGELPLDFATASAHKFNGPKGIGFLFVRKGLMISPLLSGGGQERDLRAGTENLPAIMGLAFALNKAYTQLDEKTTHLRDLQGYLRQRLLTTFPDIQINGDPDPTRSLPTVLNVSFPVEEDLMLLFALDLAGVAASAGSACNAGALQGSHVLQQIGASPGAVRNTVRFSFGRQNTREEVDYLMAQLEAALVK
jgi:cysteine desulfurase